MAQAQLSQAEKIAQRDGKRAAKQKEREDREAREKAEREAAKAAKRALKQEEREKQEAKIRAEREADRHAQRLARQQKREAEEAQEKAERDQKRKDRVAQREREKAEKKAARANRVVRHAQKFEDRRATTKLPEGVRRPKATFIIRTGAGFTKPQSVSTRGRILKWIEDNVEIGSAVAIMDVAKACRPFMYGASVRGFLSKLEETGHIDFWYGEDSIEDESEAEQSEA